AGGIISLGRSLPLIWGGIREGLRDVGGGAKAGKSTLRTEDDLSMRFVFAGIVVLILAIMLARPLHMNLLGALLIVLFGFLFVTVSSRLTGEIGSSSNPISGMTVATLLLTCMIFLLIGWTGGSHYVTALSVGAIVCIAASNGGTTSQDLKTGFLVGATPRLQQIAILVGALASALMLGPILLKLNDGATVYVPVAEVAPGLATDAGNLAGRERLQGPQARSDGREYLVWQKRGTEGGPEGKYLVDDAGTAVWFVDPGINGAYSTRPDGTTIRKFDAPKATLMSYIIRGILDRRLPMGLILFGVMIAVVLEMSAIPSLAFAVGVYLPLSSSSPIFIGGMIRWLVDRARRRKLRDAGLTEAQLVAESDKSAGVLMASGYIAGGAIAGILIAFMAGSLGGVDETFTRWAAVHNPFFAGPFADLLAIVPFAVLSGLLYLVGRERLLA
ncbi:MAG: peptide transporter, partial [Candidatus Latescibacterota bacterium]